MGLSMIQLASLGCHEGRRHPFCLGHRQVSRHVLEHCRRLWINAVSFKKEVVGALCGLRNEAGGDDVEGVLKKSFEAKLLRRQDGMGSRSVGEYELAPR